MLRMVLDRMRNKPWMTASLLLANLLLVAIVAANVLYTDAVSQRMLTRTLGDELVNTNQYPLDYQLSLELDYQPSRGRASTVDPVLRRLWQLPARAGLEAQQQSTIWTTDRLRMLPELRRGDADPMRMSFGSMSGYESRIVVRDWARLEGYDSAETALERWRTQPGLVWPESAPTGERGEVYEAEGVLDAFISESSLVGMQLIPGETLEVLAQYGLHLDAEPRRTVFRVRILGVIAEADLTDPFWVRPLAYGSNQLWLPEQVFDDNLLARGPGLVGLRVEGRVRMDYSVLGSGDVATLMAETEALSAELDGARIAHSERYMKLLDAYQLRSRQLQLTLLMLQLPLGLLLIAYIVMVSGRLAALESDEIAQLRSRGASRGQIIRLYAVQGLVMAGVAILLGLPLAVAITQLIGSANAFLSFVAREALPLRAQPLVFVAAIIGALAGLLAMLIPAAMATRYSIVERKRDGRAGRTAFNLVRALIALSSIGIALYTQRNYSQRQDLLALDIRSGQSLDGMLFLSSSLFMLGIALLIAQLVPLLIRLVFAITRRLWGAGLYVSFLQMIRSRTSYGFIVVLLVLTVAMGVFGASVARTINTGSEDEIRYRNGSDLILREVWSNNADEQRVNPDAELIFYEPDFGAYEAIPGVERATRVYVNDQVRVRTDGGRVNNVVMMGVDSRAFGETLRFIDGLLPEHINSYLNAMSRDPRGVLVSDNFRRDYGVKLGDVITSYDARDNSTRGIVAGFVDYFPGFVPRAEHTTPDGQTRLEPRYLVVANLGELQARMGLAPYEVWLRSADPDAVLDFAETSGRNFQRITDTRTDLVAMKNDPSVQGTNGILTISFVITMLLCTTGFLIYWVLSIRSRTLVFGIHRAMGLGSREILGQLINEQIFITLPALAGGLVTGLLAARLFVPLIQTAYAEVDRALPLRMPSIGGDILRLAIALTAMITLCLAVLMAYIRRIRIAQALKLGED